MKVVMPGGWVGGGQMSWGRPLSERTDNWRKILLFPRGTHFQNRFPEPAQYGTSVSLP